MIRKPKMDFKVLKWQMLHGSFMRRLILRTFAFGSAMLVFSLIQIAHEARTFEPLELNFDECPLNFGSNPYDNGTEFSNPLSFLRYSLLGGFRMPSKENEKLAKNVFEELMGKNLLDPNSKTLCIGDSSATAVAVLRDLGFTHAVSVGSHPTFSLLKRKYVCELDFEDDSFDFVYSRALDTVPVPALLVLEIERILRPGGIGAMLVGARDFHTGSLIRSATPVSLFLKSSDIVYVCGVGPNALVIFKKRFENAGYFERFQLPNDCPAIKKNKPFMKFIEPLVDKKSLHTTREVSYLPKYLDISSRNRMIYVNVGAEESTKFNLSQLSQPYDSIHPRAFSVYMIDHNISVLSSHVKNPGITFIYHPGLAEEDATAELDSDEYLGAPLDEGGFDFIDWFKDTVEDDDFVVLRINARTVKLNILGELFQSGAICHVDELFLHCPENDECKGGAFCGDCLSLFKDLRNSGVFVHQWFGE
ncbi:OLC1v1003962C1 [Oldenlandia corymbosa var. corymbosa]|uniref:OLC1v1003962C1 n=1 Tax=Oldenlandia corymbosa var. corymbosa TaxID=529605 RepID=A0AAV1DE63_OLDCO|nr:OLC1v1003962C1 [Oldenlandia corymbosa var. corymbosa]